MPNFYYQFKIRLVLLVIIALSMVWLFSDHKVKPFTVSSLALYQCDVKNSKGNNVFNVYIPSNMKAEQYANSLCDKVLVGTHYSSVTISWQPKKNITTEDIVKQHYDILFNRHSDLAGLIYDFKGFYNALLEFPSSGVYWLSSRDKPILSQAYFNDKRIGLLRDNQSRSSYQEPLKQLNEYNIQLPDNQFTFYTNHDELFAALLNQEVDLISTFSHSTINSWPPDQKTLITEKTESGNWYIRQDTEANLRCKIKKSLSLYVELVEKMMDIAMEEITCSE